MNIGTHNSLTYLTPKKWWQKLIKFTAKCQEVNYEKQYELGARVFDVRLWYDDDLESEVRHGRIAYKGGVDAFIGMLDFLEEKGDCYVRIICEEDFLAKNNPLSIDKEKRFINMCRSFERAYKNIKFFGGNRKYDWKVLYNFENKDVPNLIDRYSSTTSLFKSDKKWLAVLDDLYPKLYAKLKNKQIIKEHNDKEGYLFIDFINIK